MAGALSDLKELEAATSEARSVLRRLERLHGRLQGTQSADLLRQAEARARLRGLLRDGAD